MRFSFICLLLALSAAGAAAQPRPAGTLTGSVTDADGAPLVGATVALYADDAFVTGTASGADGAFRLDGVPPATYRVRVSFVGYVPEEREEVAVGAGSTADLGAVALAADVARLGEAEVSAERELVEQRVDRTVYNVAAQPVTAGGSALETLQTLPSIEVDTDGNLSLRGGQNVAVHLNGRPVPVRGAQLAALLRQIPASNVERVEVMPNPSARYEPDGMSGIINVVMKQGTSRGLSGGLTLGGGTAPNAEASANVAYQRGPWDAYASYGYRYDAFGLRGLSTRVLLGNGSTVDQRFGLENEAGSHLLTGSLDYAPAERTTLGFSGTLGLRSGEADQAVAYAFGADAAPVNLSTRRTEGGVDGVSADAALTLRQHFGDGHQLTAEARYTRNENDRDEAFYDTPLVPAGGPVGDEALSFSLANDRTDETSAQLDYALPFEPVRVEVGAKATQREIQSDRYYSRFTAGDLVRDPARSSDFAYDEGVYAAYAQLTRAVGRFELQVGDRLEVATRDLRLGAYGGTERYTSHYPSAFVLYTVAEGTSAKLSMSRRVNRPQAFALNPAPRFQDTLLVDVGNPELRPEYTTAFELALQYRFAVSLTPFYRRTTDVIRRRIVFDPATGVTTGTFQNLDTADSYGVDLTLTPRLGPVRAVLAASAFRTMTDGGSVEAGLASDGTAWTLRGNLQAPLWKGADLQLFGFYRSPLELEDGRVTAFGLATVGLSQRLGERFRLAVRANDVLGTAEFEFDTGNADYTFHGFRDPALRQVSATLTYTFGQGQPRRPRPQQPQQGGGLDNVGF